MIRLFAAIDLPSSVRQALATLKMGIPRGRWIDPAEMHLTLRFIGEVDGAVAEDVRTALGGISHPSFTIMLEGVGQFGDKTPRTLFAGVQRSEPLMRLAAKIEQTLQRIGLPPETRRYTPHVTLARLNNGPRTSVAEFLAEHGLFRAGPVSVDAFELLSSNLGHNGAHYQQECTYPLA
jgi:RNA 2',3'-cyclic 3'-phosphodiesterase